jgi:hypothetical protein
MAVRVVLVKAFGSKTALVDGMIGAPSNAGDVRASHTDVDAAPYRAHATRRWYPPFNLDGFVLQRKAPWFHLIFPRLSLVQLVTTRTPSASSLAVA